ncbi:Holliday junction branch migration protein RuvA [Fodinicurvata sp. EGI_FJ10296]|uniref:Holliday junction branch migration protein RuvA n=1 Tax=Fodinicurvata sp. EGI_FJ10296 TaxID=3231908 RepID=UPI003454C016
MIAKLRGILDMAGTDSAVIDVGGVGYLVFCSGRTLSRLGEPGAPVTVIVETQVREDHIHLFGFAEARERDWFRLLTTVQGVGSRVALAILSVLAPDDVANAIMAQDKAALTRADGVGPKLAGRILSELKDKTGSIGVPGKAGAAAGIAAAAPMGDRSDAPAGATGDTLVEDAVSALVNLGYGRSDAFAAVRTAMGDLGTGTSLARLIPRALKELAR